MCTRTAPLNKNAHLANCDAISRDPSFLTKFWCQQEEMERVTRSKVIKFYKVVWSNHSEQDHYLCEVYPTFYEKW